jgi:hypothetical protein
MPYITVNTDVDIDLDDIDTEDLIEELERRGKNPNDIEMINLELKEIVEKIWMNRRTGKEYQSELNELIYNVLGKVI